MSRRKDLTEEPIMISDPAGVQLAKDVKAAFEYVGDKVQEVMDRHRQEAMALADIHSAELMQLTKGLLRDVSQKPLDKLSEHVGYELADCGAIIDLDYADSHDIIFIKKQETEDPRTSDTSDLLRMATPDTVN